MYDDADLGLALTRDCNSARAFDTLQRYRGSALAEFFRALRTLQALQAEARSEVRDAAPHHAAAAAPPTQQGAPGPVAPPARCRAAEDAAVPGTAAGPASLRARTTERTRNPRTCWRSET